MNPEAAHWLFLLVVRRAGFDTGNSLGFFRGGVHPLSRVLFSDSQALGLAAPRCRRTFSRTVWDPRAEIPPTQHLLRLGSWVKASAYATLSRVSLPYSAGTS